MDPVSDIRTPAGSSLDGLQLAQADPQSSPDSALPAATTAPTDTPEVIQESARESGQEASQGPAQESIQPESAETPDADPAAIIENMALLDVDPALATEPGAWQSLLEPLPEPLAQGLILGGPVTLVLLVLSVVALTIILFKSVELFVQRRRGKKAVNTALTHWREGRGQEALAALSDAREGGVAKLVHTAMIGVQATDVPLSIVREELQRVAAGMMEKIRGHLRTLEVIGMVSPLLGLFGTVLGMIEAFRQMENAGSQVDPAVLSGGIWQALLTTGVGLAVAIPTVLAHQWLDRRAERHALGIEDVITQVFTAAMHKPAALPEQRAESARLSTHAA